MRSACFPASTDLPLVLHVQQVSKTMVTRSALNTGPLLLPALPIPDCALFGFYPFRSPSTISSSLWTVGQVGQPHGVIYLHVHRSAGDCALLQPVSKSLTDHAFSLSKAVHLLSEERCMPSFGCRGGGEMGLVLLPGTGPLSSTIRSHVGLFGLFKGVQSSSFTAFARAFHEPGTSLSHHHPCPTTS